MKVKINSISPNGLGVGKLDDDKTVFVYGALPDEIVEIAIIKDNAKYSFAEVVSVEQPNENRVEPRDKNGYLATSPFQISNYDYENEIKTNMVKDSFQHFKLDIKLEPIVALEQEYNYRNKYSYSFPLGPGPATPSVIPVASSVIPAKAGIQPSTGTPSVIPAQAGIQPSTGTPSVIPAEAGIQPSAGTKYRFGVSSRLSNNIIAVDSISLPEQAIIDKASEILLAVEQAKIDPKYLDSLVIRSNRNGETISKLMLRDYRFDKMLMEQVKDLEVRYYDKDTPENQTVICSNTDLTLTDELLGNRYEYSIDSFWQSNPPVYELAINKMIEYLSKLSTNKVLDLYCGVGSIGISLSSKIKGIERIDFVESDINSYNFLKTNIEDNINAGARAIHSTSERAVNHITSDTTLILDPPRAGLDKKVIETILAKTPPIITYLSCNPFTQARDIALLSEKYRILLAKPYNFFPKTLHIENLVILKLRD
jgi:23S rRNA (uracil1939-C5)-methyltransferase